MGRYGPKRHTKSIGEYSEVVIAERLLRGGYNVLTPYGDSLRYDLVIEDADGGFWRVQCKTAWIDKRTGEDVVKFATSSSHYHYRGGIYDHGRRGYQGQIDYFAVYSPDLDKVYLVPIDHAGSSDMSLRLAMPKGRNQHGIKMAEDYEL
jgi:PD-(D/E)XK endonuclease